MVNIIANSCVGGYIYRKYSLQYNNPFMWSVMKVNDMTKCILNFEKVNWGKIHLTLTKDNYFILTVDSCFDIHFTHYILVPGMKNVKLNDADVLSDDIYKYVYCKYISRVKRMIEQHVQPTFVIMCTTQGRYDYSRESIIRMLEQTTDSPYHKYLITDMSELSYYENAHTTILYDEHPINYDPYNTKFYADYFGDRIISSQKY